MILCWEGTCELHFMSGMEKILQSGHFLLSQFKVWTWNRIFCCKFCLFKDNPYFKAIISVGCLCDKNVWWWVGQLNHALLLSNYSKHHFIWPTESILNLPMAVWREIFSKTHDRLILILNAHPHTNNRYKHFPTNFQNNIQYCFDNGAEKIYFNKDLMNLTLSAFYHSFSSTISIMWMLCISRPPSIWANKDIQFWPKYENLIQISIYVDVCMLEENIWVARSYQLSQLRLSRFL